MGGHEPSTSTSSAASHPEYEMETYCKHECITIPDNIGSPASRESYSAWKFMPPDDLFEISMMTEDSKQKVPTLFLAITRIEFNDGQFRICVENGNEKNDVTKIEMIICQQHSFPSKLKRLKEFLRTSFWPVIRPSKINDKVYDLKKCSLIDNNTETVKLGETSRNVTFKKTFTVYTNDVSMTYGDLLSHLFFVFPKKIPLLSLDLRGICTENFHIPTELLDNYEQCRLCPCLAIKIQKNEFVEQAHQILEKMSELKNLKLDIAVVETEFFNPKMCNINHLYIIYSNNHISEANFLSLNCETIELWSVKIGASLLNKFIKMWLKSKGTKFQSLKIPLMSFEENDSDAKDIIKDLDVKKFDELNRTSIYKSYEWNYEFNCQGDHRFFKCHSGWDIRRSDGVLATIIHEPNLFYFLVWHDRFPDQPKDHIRYLDSE